MCWLDLTLLFNAAGIKLMATLHSSVSTSGEFQLDGLKLVDFRVDFPQQEADIITIK